MKITSQRLHKVIQEEINVLSTFHSVSQKIDRNTYSLFCGFKNIFGIMTAYPELMVGICKSLDNAGIKYDSSEIERGFIKVMKTQ